MAAATASSESIVFHQQIDTKLNADAVEWCPIQNYHRFALLGTYQLNESSDQTESPSRTGQFEIHQLEDVSPPRLKSEEKLETAGILDIKWSTNHSESPIFGLVNARGSAQFYSLQKSGTKCRKIGDLSIENDGLGLAICWSGQGRNDVITCTSLGNLALIDANEMKLKNCWKAHEYEAWTCAFDQTEANIIYSGGDDCKFKVWDTRLNEAVRCVSKEHSMGVTNISVDPMNTHRLCTGSYDEYLREWDTRTLTKPLQRLNVGGGIWRIKYCPFANNHVAIAAMHNGVHIVSLKDPTRHFRFTKHESMAYGVDWCHEKMEENHFLLTSCSFYDCSLKLWSWTDDQS